MTRVTQVGRLAFVLTALCCVFATAQDGFPVSTQVDRSDIRFRSRTTRAAAPNCPELENLGYVFRRLVDVPLDIRLLDSNTPDDCSVNLFRGSNDASLPMARPSTEFTWAPTELFHKPLYFEDAILERAGQAKHPILQPC